jgi:hypothetical protein
MYPELFVVVGVTITLMLQENTDQLLISVPRYLSMKNEPPNANSPAHRG